jgi:hypothetical protein
MFAPSYSAQLAAKPPLRHSSSLLDLSAPPHPHPPHALHTPNRPGPYLRPMRRLTSYTVRVGFTVAWFFAASPIKRSVSVNAT